MVYEFPQNPSSTGFICYKGKVSRRAIKAQERASFVSKVHAKPPLLSTRFFLSLALCDDASKMERRPVLEELVNSLSLFRKIHCRASLFCAQKSPRFLYNFRWCN